MKFRTKCIHVGQEPDRVTGAVIPPIVQSTTFAQEAPGEHRGFEYTRADNPNYRNLEVAIAALESATHGVIFSSGLGAASAVLLQLRSGDHVVAIGDLYGGSFRLLNRLSEQFGIEVTFLDDGRPETWKKAAKQKTKLFWLESPTNPLLQIVDIRAVAHVGKEKGVKVLVDNTFATPYFQRPLELGADIVLHSTTKYIGGHSDVIGGALVTNDVSLGEQFKYARMIYGFNPSPFDAWLVTRGLKTLGLRMEQHQRGAEAVAAALLEQKCVEKVYYPGLHGHPGHEIAKRQMSGFGGMVSARFRCPPDHLKKRLASFRYFTLAESLGGVESLVCHPATMTHASIPQEIRKKHGITDTLVRFSVGIEEEEDLVADVLSFVESLTSRKF